MNEPVCVLFLVNDSSCHRLAGDNGSASGDQRAEWPGGMMMNPSQGHKMVFTAVMKSLACQHPFVLINMQRDDKMWHEAGIAALSASLNCGTAHGDPCSWVNWSPWRPGCCLIMHSGSHPLEYLIFCIISHLFFSGGRGSLSCRLPHLIILKAHISPFFILHIVCCACRHLLFNFCFIDKVLVEYWWSQA